MTRFSNHPQDKPLVSVVHFSVDGTLIEAWASRKSFRPRDGSGVDDYGANFDGQMRWDDTPASTSDADSRLYRQAAGRRPSSAIWPCHHGEPAWAGGGRLGHAFLARPNASGFGGHARSPGRGRPPLPTRSVAGPFMLSQCAIGVTPHCATDGSRYPYVQYFCGEVVFRHDLPFDRSSLTPLAPAAG